jgi:hypothetical protein
MERVMDHPSSRPLKERWRSKRQNPVPRVLLILLLFALPLVLIPVALDSPGPSEPPPRADAREEVSRALAQQGVVLGEEPPAPSEEPVVVAGAFVTASALDPPPLVEPQIGDGLVLLDDDDDMDDFDSEDADSAGEIDELDEAWDDDWEDDG